MTEKQWQALVQETAQLAGWMAYHTYDSRRSAAGFPDLVLARERVIFRRVEGGAGPAFGGADGVAGEAVRRRR